MVRLKKNIPEEEWGDLTASQKLAWFIGLKYSEDLKTLGWFAVQTAVFIYTWRNFYSLGIFTKIFMFVWLCYHSCVVSLIGHNVMHGAMFGNRILAKCTQFFLTFFFGIPMSIYLPAHNLSHHPNPQRRKDCLRTSLVSYEDSGYLPGNFWNCVLFNQFCQKGAITVDIQYIAMMMKLKRPFFYQAMSEIVLILGSIVYLGYCDWLKMLILWKLPQEIAQAFMIGFSFMQHDGCEILPEDNADLTNHPNISRTWTGKTWNFFGFNSGYHSIHHLHPNLHWSLMPKAHEDELVNNPDPAKRIDPRLCVDNMAVYFWEHHCKKGKRVRYDGKPIDWSKHPAKDAPVDTEVFEWSSHVNKEEIQAYTASVSAGAMFFVEALGVWARDMFLPALPVVGFGSKKESKLKRG